MSPCVSLAPREQDEFLGGEEHRLEFCSYLPARIGNLAASLTNCTRDAVSACLPAMEGYEYSAL